VGEGKSELGSDFGSFSMPILPIYLGMEKSNKAGLRGRMLLA
jgi:hypothetical protein